MVTTSTQAIKGNFIQSVPTPQGLTQFSFLRKATPYGEKYFILAMDKNLRAYWFIMEQQGSQWRINEPERVPKWITAIETDLSNAIALKSML